MSAEYQALVAKVAGFVDGAAARRRADMRCQQGCAACCQTWLSVGPVEAATIRRGLGQLPAEQREQVRERGLRELTRERQGSPEPCCAMLDPNGSCAIYAHRPLVCRTQGHALRYSLGLIPEQALRARTKGGDVTWCPLNYTEAAPAAADVLDAERVDQLLALVNLRYVEGQREAALTRTSVSALAASDP
jgi:Fe-S-cluster containining protein